MPYLCPHPSHTHSSPDRQHKQTEETLAIQAALKFIGTEAKARITRYYWTGGATYDLVTHQRIFHFAHQEYARKKMLLREDGAVDEFEL
jgi:hypothetical protein